MSTPVAAPSGRPRATRAVVAAASVLALLALLALVASAGRETHSPMEPRNPGPEGAQALARILGAQGVDVSVAEGLPALEDQELGGDTTLVIGTSTQLTATALDAALDAAPRAGRVVVLAPSPDATYRLGLVAHTVRSEGEPLEPGCEGVRGDLRITPGGTAYTAGGADAVRCFRGDAEGGQVVRIPAFEGRPEVWVVGATTALSNAHLAENGNAALGLAVLGHSRHVVWYQAQAADTPADADGNPNLDDIVPRWVGYVVVMLFAALVVTMLWRGRRFGRLVREPLPVLVRAGEITEARGRLYRKARDCQRAGRALQIGTRRRLATRFGLSASAPPEHLVPETALATGRSPQELHAILYAGIPSTDAELLRLAQQLLTIEEEVKGS